MALIPDQLRLMAESFPDETAYKFIGVGEMTFADWERGANRVAHGLLERGVEAQDRVALLFSGEDAARNLQAYMGTHKAGAVTVPVNNRLAAGEIRQILEHAEPRVVIVSEQLEELARTSLPPLVEHVVTTGAGTDAAVGWESFCAEDTSDVQVPITADDMADILYTSGTTGLPKGVVVRHRNGTQMEVGKPDVFTGLCYQHASPFFTFAGLSFLFVPMRLGFTGIYLPRFDAGTWLEVAEREPVAMTFVVPAMVELLLAHPDLETRDLSSLMLVSVGSAPISPTSLEELHKHLPNATVSNSYSLTEAGTAYCVMPPEEFARRPGSVGTPVAPLEVRIADETGDPLPSGEIGEILIRNPGKEREYFRNPEATAETWRDGWLHTGDLGRLDEDGYLYIVGRQKDVIIRGGNNVYATDVEAAIAAHPKVLDVAVIGVPHQILGEDVAAFVIPRPEEEFGEDEITEWCAGRLADYKRPRTVRIVEELPRNAMGKVLKRILREELTS